MVSSTVHTQFLVTITTLVHIAIVDLLIKVSLSFTDVAYALPLSISRWIIPARLFTELSFLLIFRCFLLLSIS